MPASAETQSQQPLVRFDLASKGGPLLAVAGLCGGAGASTLTLLIAAAAARDAARSGGAPVLAIDAGAATGGLAAYTDLRCRRSLADVAALVADGRPLDAPPFVELPDGLRVLATTPRPPSDADEPGTRRVLSDAQQAHGLTVVDCGTLARRADWVALAAATHVAWLLPATSSGVRRGRVALDAAAAHARGLELVVARRDATASKAPTRPLTELADERRSPLVLMPHVPDLSDADLDTAIESAEVTLQAIATVVRQWPR